MSINYINDGDSGLTIRTVLNEMVSFINNNINYIGTGSFATTGSNQFNGNQSISGSITTNESITWNNSSFNSLTQTSGSLYFSSLNGGTLHLNNDGGEGDIFMLNGQGNKVYLNGNQIITGSLKVTGSVQFSSILTLTPQSPLPNGVAIGSFAVSSSVPPRPYMWDGSSWYAL